MRITLLGATGRVGRPTLDAAVLDGHDVHALARRPGAVPAHAGVTTALLDLSEGDTSTLTVRLAGELSGSDAVISALGADRADPQLLERALPLLAEAARQAGVRRVVHVGAFGAGETAQRASWRARGIYAGFERRRLTAHARALAAVDTAGLEWTTVLPIRLRDGSPQHVFAVVPMDEVQRVPGLPLLPYGNLATALVSLATQPEHTPGPLLVTSAAGVRLTRAAQQHI